MTKLEKGDKVVLKEKQMKKSYNKTFHKREIKVEKKNPAHKPGALIRAILGTLALMLGSAIFITSKELIIATQKVSLGQAINPGNIKSPFFSISAILGKRVVQIGSGFAVLHKGETYIVTNAHVCLPVIQVKAMGEEIIIANYSGAFNTKENKNKQYVFVKPEEFILAGEGLDLCLIKTFKTLDGKHLTKLDLDYLPLQVQEPKFGESVVAIGNIHRHHRLIHRGHYNHKVQAYARQGKAFRRLYANVGVHSGMSGGALFNSDGEIIGVITEAVGDSSRGLDTDSSFHTPIEYVIELLKEMK